MSTVNTNKPKGRKRKYAEYEELLKSLKTKSTGRPIYKYNIGICVNKLSTTVWLKIRLPHGGVYN